MSEEDKEELKKIETILDEISRKYGCNFCLECMETKTIDSLELVQHYKFSAYVPEKQIY